MSNKILNSISFFMIVVGIILLVFVPIAGQIQSAKNETWTLPRTPDGQPDLQGVWANNNATPLERPKELAGKQVLTDEELAELKKKATNLFGIDAGDAAFGDQVFQAALTDTQEFQSSDFTTGNYNQFWIVERDWDNRTSLVINPSNGRIPSLTPEGEKRVASSRIARQRPAHGPEDRSLGERCITFGVPRLGAGYNSYYQILQTPGYVVIVMEINPGPRIIPLDGRPHISQNIRQWNGDSRGHWEGDTLIVDTTNYSPKSNFKGSAENLHLVERFKRVGPDTIEYEVNINDSSIWTAPWTAMIPLKKSEDPIFEYACHEGNIGMEGILAGARATEKTANEEAKIESK